MKRTKIISDLAIQLKIHRLDYETCANNNVYNNLRMFICTLAKSRTTVATAVCGSEIAAMVTAACLCSTHQRLIHRAFSTATEVAAAIPAIYIDIA